MKQNTTAAPKEPKKEPKAKKRLILNKAIHIAGVKDAHRIGGAHYKAGDEVTPEMIEAYEANRKLIGGQTPIDKFCN